MSRRTVRRYVVSAGVVLAVWCGPSRAAILQWTGAVDDDWHKSGNWNPAQVPADGDDVVIAGGATDPVYSSGTTILASLAISGKTLYVVGGELGMAGASGVASGGFLSVGGTGTVLTVDGTLTVAGTLVVNTGTIGGSGTVDAQSGSTVRLGVTGPVTLDGVSLQIGGSGTWESSSLTLQGGAELSTAAGGTLSVTATSATLSAGSGSGSLVCAGTLQRSSGSGDVVVRVPLSNSGTVEVSSSTVRISTAESCVNAGTLQVAGGAQLLFTDYAGTVRFDPGTVLQGDGEIGVWYGGTLELGTDVTVPAGMLFSTTAHVTGTGNLRVEGRFTANDTFLEGSGRLEVASGGELEVTGGLRQDPMDVDNSGTATWSGGGWTLAGGSVLTNQLGGTLNLQASGVLGSGTGGGSLVNHGLLVASPGLHVDVDVPLTSDGTVEAASGGLRFTHEGPNVVSGTLQVAGGAQLLFTDYAGTVRFDPGTVLQGDGEIGVWYGGTLELGTDVTVPAGMLFSTTAHVTGTGNLRVEGRFTANDTFLEGSGRLEVASGGELEVTGGLRQDPMEVDNSGTATWSGGGWTLAGGAELINQAGGVLAVDTHGTLASDTGGGTVTNHGELRITETMSSLGVALEPPLVNDGRIVVESVQSDLSIGPGGLTNQSGGELAGNGTVAVQAGAPFLNEGSVAPGLSPGTLTLNTATFPNAGTSTWEMEVNGTAGGTYDRLVVSGEAILGGWLNPWLGPGTAVGLGTTLPVATFSTWSGGFAGVGGDDPGSCLDWLWYCAPGTLYLHVTSQGPLLAVSGEAGADPVTVGESVTVHAAVVSRGPGTATGTQLTVALPAQLSYLSAAPSQGSCSEAGGVVTCTLGDLAAGGTASVTVTAQASAAGDVLVQVEGDADQCDPVGSDDTAGVSLRLTAAVACDADAGGDVGTQDLPVTVAEIFGTEAPGNPDCTRSGGVNAADLAAVILQIFP